MNIMDFLKAVPTVLQILTSERTQNTLKDMTEDVADAVKAVNEASQDAAHDIVSIFEELLDEMEELHGTGFQERLVSSRSLVSPERAESIERAREIFEEAINENKAL